MKFNQNLIENVFKLIEESVLSDKNYNEIKEHYNKLIENKKLISEVSKEELKTLKKHGYSDDIEIEIRKDLEKAIKTLLHKEEFERKGVFISITGIDKSGKETQIFGSDIFPDVEPLIQFLEKSRGEVLYIDLPNYNTLLGMIYAACVGTNKAPIKLEKLDFPRYYYLAVALDRAKHNSDVAEVLENGGIIIANRWKESNPAYQPIFTGKKFEFFVRMEKNIIEPDLIVYIDITAEESIERIKRNKFVADDFEKLEIQKKVRENYLKLAKTDNWIMINGMRSPEGINKEIKEKIYEFLNTKK